jgi:myo-inositol-1(or 4)-monophosphatase
MKMFETLMPLCAGLRRPGSAALDLCYVAAGYYDAFFETGLSPWDIAAGSLIVTEAGGLVGNFTGEPDFMNQREILAGAPKIYGQLVPLLSPFTRVIQEETAPPRPRRPTRRPLTPPPKQPPRSASRCACARRCRGRGRRPAPAAGPAEDAPF